MRPRQNDCHFADDTFKRIFMNENVRISIKTLLKFVPNGPLNNIPALVQIMAWLGSYINSFDITQRHIFISIYSRLTYHYINKEADIYDKFLKYLFGELCCCVLNFTEIGIWSDWIQIFKTHNVLPRKIRITSAALPCHFQVCDKMRWLRSNLKQNEFNQEFQADSLSKITFGTPNVQYVFKISPNLQYKSHQM